ncbi:MAG TPA: VWA domain-containing protein [Thermopetrobacter sp.]|nr:VWA domain-containing protein [Thermopetrobacter sp.]
MSVDVEEYRDELVAAAPELAETLDAMVHEAARYMSPAGLSAWLDGARALTRLRKEPALVVTWLDEMPEVAREVGEDVVREVATAVMKLASMVSGSVLTLMLATLPLAARRLGDAQLMRAYLQLLHRTAAKAPRGMRPMLEVLDELLTKLTLSGLRNWIDFGAEAYRRDFARQADYFGLKTEDAKAVLQDNRRGTLFIDVQRKINFYLRAFWGRDFFLRPAAADYENFRPYIEERALHLPDAVDDIGDVTGLELYRAMAAHMAAHLMYTDAPQGDADMLSPAQRFFIGLAEDARVEYCAIRRFPGMKALWMRLLPPRDDAHPHEHRGMPLIEAMVRHLLDADAPTGDADIDAVIGRFHAEAPQREMDLDTAFSRDIGLALHDILATRRDMPSLRILEKLRAPWRDDNRLIWAADEAEWVETTAYLPHKTQVRKHVSVMEFINEVDVETAGDDAQEIWVLSSELFPYEDEGVSYNEMEGKEPVYGPFHHHEWDYQVQLHRPSWVSVFEHRPKRGDPEIVDKVLVEHRGITHRLRQVIDRLRPQGLVRERKLEDGDVLDLNAAVDAMVMLKAGLNPDPRITMRYRLNRRDLSVLLLLDLSESTNDLVRDSDKTVLELTREACALLSYAVEGIGDPFAIHGFNSDGRHDVRYFCIKDFEQHFDDDVKSRLAGMRGGFSTRMGAALRHAGDKLLQRGEKNKLILLITDGEPADIDERDPQYLRMDTRKAVEELRRKGVLTYCLTLDPNADMYVSRIFGATNYTVVDNITRLPEKLPALFASLTR